MNELDMLMEPAPEVLVYILQRAGTRAEQEMAPGAGAAQRRREEGAVPLAP